jgi:hypothetical protein
MVAIIGGEFRRFRPLIDLYREAGRRAGYSPDQLKVGVHALGYVAATWRFDKRAGAVWRRVTVGRLSEGGQSWCHSW